MHVLLVSVLLIAQSTSSSQSSYSFYSAAPTATPDSSSTAPSTPHPVSVFSFDSLSYSYPDTDSSAVFGVLRTGTAADAQLPASVCYYTIDGTARAGVGKQNVFPLLCV